MKKFIIIVFSLIFLVGCTKNDNKITISNLEGYWLQIESDWSGDVTDMTNNPYAYLKITKDNLYFYTENQDDKGYIETEAKKYYRLEGNKIYYDYEKLTGKDWKENIHALYGGVFTVLLDDDKLILTSQFGDSSEDGYEKDTYKRLSKDFKLLDPQTNE